MNVRLLRTLLFLPLFSVGIATGQEADSPAPMTAIPPDRLLLPISENRQMEVVVSLPHRYDPDEKYPVLIVTDADPLLGLLKTLNFLWTEDGKTEPVILVGLPFGANADEIWTNRSWYLLPNPIGVVDYYDIKLPVNNGGGAPELARFIHDTVLPEISRRYSIDGDRMGLGGFSMGGLFAAWHFINHPGVFTDYLISAPPLTRPFTGDAFKERLNARREAGFDRPTKLYTAYAENDLQQVQKGVPTWIRAWQSLDDPNLQFRSQVVANARLDGGAIFALIDGFEFLYAK
ncbi:MAG: hypothetical protein HUJ31_13050 [Pseudomonadales bacterium]|nr:hypothetical protein [Pseudomonadales bacterium]